jgi:arginine decarboxylase
MIERTSKVIHQRVLVIDDELNAQTVGGRSVRALVDELCARGAEVVEAASAEDGEKAIVSDASIHVVMLDWSMGGNDEASHAKAAELLRLLRHRNDKIPVFLMADRKILGTLSLEVVEMVDEYVWILEDTAAMIAGRALAAATRYLAGLLPPFAAAMAKYSQIREYSWAAPGHQGGVAFTKSPVGRIFFDFYGENLFRSDMGIERSPLGSLLDHTGPVLAGEQYAAQVFGAHRSYSGIVGSSGSNRTVMTAAINEGEIALCDRNCHKSIEHGLVITGGIPTYLVPTRNRYGIIGPIPPQRLTPEAIQTAIAANPLAKGAAGPRPVYAIVTNCTYDGMCYNAATVQDLLDQSVDRIHFDEAWYGYARFNPIYKDRFAMRGDPAQHRGPTVFATQSTHKLLAALSQGSFIHVRDGRNPINHDRFNEAYMMHTSTSPLYAIIASNDIAAAMMDGVGGPTLTGEAITEAVSFRQALARIKRELARQGQWFFAPWNAPHVCDPATGEMIPFADAPLELLTTDPDCWVLHPGDNWHGFVGLPDGYCMLDPIKVGIVTPGMGPDGELEQWGIPATLITTYLDRHGIVVARTTDFQVLFLFSIGVTRGKWGTLVGTLLDFKRDYDRNAPLSEVLPALVADHPDRYRGVGLRDLGEEMFAYMKTSQQGQALQQAYSTLPHPEMTPRRAYQRLVAGDVEPVAVDNLAGRVAAVGVIPYPPGIPMVMPGENFGPADGPYLTYLRARQTWDREFPGFGLETEGVDIVDGAYTIYAMKQ